MAHVKILIISYLEKGRNIQSEYYIALLVHLKQEIAKKRPQMKMKKRSFTKTMHRVTSRSQRWKNYMNSILNCFCSHSILQIWLPVTTDFLQTSKECSRERDLGLMKKWYRKLAYFEAKDKSFDKKGMGLLEKRWNQWITRKKRLC